MENKTIAVEKRSAVSNNIKIISTFLIFSAIALQLSQLLTPLPPFLHPIVQITAVVLAIHAVEGVVSAILISQYRLTPVATDTAAETASSALLTQKLPKSTSLAVLKAGLYVFFVGTVGLVEVVAATRTDAVESGAAESSEN